MLRVASCLRRNLNRTTRRNFKYYSTVVENVNSSGSKYVSTTSSSSTAPISQKVTASNSEVDVSDTSIVSDAIALERVLKNAARRSSHQVYCTSGARALIFAFADRTIARLIARSLDPATARSLARSLDCSLIARPLSRS